MKNKAFTLIELLVVIAIIGVLSGVVITSLGSARDKAKVGTFKAEIQQFINALELYNVDNNGYPPYEMEVTWASSGTAPEDFESYLARLPVPPVSPGRFTYYPNTSDYRCGSPDVESPYILLVTRNVEGFEDGFEDWQTNTYSSEGEPFGPDYSETPETQFYCFSLN